MKFQLPNLPFEPPAVAKIVSAETLEFHMYKHHKAYVDNMNKMVEDSAEFKNSTLEELVMKTSGPLFNNAAQSWNHTFYWLGLKAPTDSPQMDATWVAAVNKEFGSVDGLKTKFIDSAKAVFGSGWTWLVADKAGKLQIVNKPNAENPMKDGMIPLLVCDVWEHAYYIDFRNARPSYLESFWKHINWDFVKKNWEAKQAADLTKLMT